MSVLMRRENTLIIEPGSDISKIQIINFILLPNSKKHFEGPPLQMPFYSAEQMGAFDEKLAQIVASELYKMSLPKDEELEKFVNLVMHQTDYHSPKFDVNNRNAKIVLNDTQSFNYDVMKTLVNQLFPGLNKVAISQDIEENAQQILQYLDEQNIETSFIKPLDLINMNLDKVKIILSQMHHEIDPLEGKKAMSTEDLNQSIISLCQHQFMIPKTMMDPQFKNFNETFGFNTEEPNYTIAVLNDPKTFVTNLRLVRPGLNIKEYKGDVDFSKQEKLKEFEQLLQTLQDNKIDTKYISPQEVVDLVPEKINVLLTEILNPSETEKQILLQDYNKYLNRINIQSPVVTMLDVYKIEVLLPLIAEMYPQAKDYIKHIKELPEEEKFDQIAELGQQLGVPSSLILSKDPIALKILQIPYDPIDDFIYISEAQTLEYLKEKGITLEAVNQIKMKELFQVVQTLLPEYKLNDQDPLTAIQKIFEQNMIPIFYNDGQVKAGNTKHLMAIINQVKLKQDNSKDFNQLKIIVNKLLSQAGIDLKIDSKADLNNPQVFSALLTATYPQLGEIEVKTFEELQNLLDECQLEIQLPTKIQKEQYQVSLLCDMLKRCKPSEELVNFINQIAAYQMELINSGKMNQNAAQIKISSYEDFRKPQNIAALLCAKFPDTYKMENIGFMSIPELVKLIQQDQRIVHKLNESEILSGKLDSIKQFVLEMYEPIDEITGKKLVSQELLTEFFNEQLKNKHIPGDFTIHSLSDLKDPRILAAIVATKYPDTVKLDKILDMTAKELAHLIQNDKRIKSKLTEQDIVQGKLDKLRSLAIELYDEVDQASGKKNMSTKELIQWVNDSFEVKQTIGLDNKLVQIEKLTDMVNPSATLAAFMCMKYPNSYKIEKIGAASVPELVQIVNDDRRVKCKLTESDLNDQNAAAIKSFLLDQYSPIDENTNKKLIPNQELLNWMNEIIENRVKRPDIIPRMQQFIETKKPLNLAAFICARYPETYKIEKLQHANPKELAQLIVADPKFKCKLSEVDITAGKLDKIRSFVLDQYQPMDLASGKPNIPQEQLIQWCNDLLEVKQIVGLDNQTIQLNKLLDLTKPENLAALLCAKYPSTYKMDKIGNMSIKELLQLIQDDKRIKCKLTEEDIKNQNVDAIKSFVLDMYQPIDESSNKKLPTNEQIINHLNEQLAKKKICNLDGQQIVLNSMKDLKNTQNVIAALCAKFPETYKMDKMMNLSAKDLAQIIQADKRIHCKLSEQDLEQGKLDKIRSMLLDLDDSIDKELDPTVPQQLVFKWLNTEIKNNKIQQLASVNIPQMRYALSSIPPLSLTEIIDLANPANLAAFICAKFPDTYKMDQLSKMSIKELAALIANEDRIKCKLTELDIKNANLDALTMFALDLYHPIDAVSDKRVLTQAQLIDWIKNSTGYEPKNLNFDLKDGQIIVELVKTLDPEIQAETIEEVLEYLHEAYPDLNYYTTENLGNQRFTQAFLTDLFEKFIMKPQIDNDTAITWVNDILSHQNLTTKQLSNITDLADGEILCAILATLDGDEDIFKNYQIAKDQNKHIPYIIETLSNKGIPDYLTQNDFIEMNGHKLLQIISEIHSDADLLMEEMKNKPAQLVEWITNELVLQGQSDMITDLKNMDAEYLEQLIPILDPQLQGTLEEIIDQLHNQGLATNLRIDHFQEEKPNLAAIELLFDGIRQRNQLPSQHLLNFVNSKLELKEPVMNLSSDMQDGIVLCKLLNKVAPELCDLKPLEIQNPHERAVMLSDYASRLDLGHLVQPEIILEGDQQKMEYILEKLIAKQKKAPEEYWAWVNTQLARAKHNELQTDDFVLTPAALCCMFEKKEFDKFKLVKEQMGIDNVFDLDQLQQATVLDTLLREQLNVDYVDIQDILDCSDKSYMLLDLLYEPAVDFTKVEMLPQNYLDSQLQNLNTEMSLEEMWQPQNLMSEIMALRPDLDFESVYTEESFEGQADKFLDVLKEEITNLRKLDYFDLISDTNAQKFLLSEVLVSKNKLGSKGQLDFVNDMLTKFTGGAKSIDTLNDLIDGQIFAQIMINTGLVDESDLKVPVHDKKGRFQKIADELTKLGFEYQLEANDFKNPQMCGIIAEFLDELIKPGDGIEHDQLLGWISDKIDEPVEDMALVFKEPDMIVKLSEILCNTAKGMELQLQPIELDSPNKIEILLNQCHQLGIAKMAKIQDLLDLNPETMDYVMTEIFAQDLPFEADLVAQLNDLLKEANLELKIDNLTDLQDNMILAQIMNELDPVTAEKKNKRIKDPLESLLKNARNLNLSNYIQPEDLTKMDKLKVMLRTAMQQRDQLNQDLIDVSKIMDDINMRIRNGEEVKIDPIHLQNLRETCAFAKFMLKLKPECFDNSRLYDYPRVKSQMKGWQIQNVMNYNVCAKVLQSGFDLDMRGVSGRDMLCGENKYLSGVLFRLSDLEHKRMSSKFDPEEVIKRRELNVDYNNLKEDNVKQILDLIVPGAVKTREGHQVQMNYLLDIARGMGIYTFLKAQDLTNPELAKAFVWQMLELLEKK
ncbi:Conserved_hypothetical protein [Hexamita inflata]|uniref:Calponin-homology (CH) domain-containing protein n=1 Tax=Hexamita inflata TaxID=28002 RepID=A0AA86PU48_9EUKA|nr:Conserved hypothetical protein [Hexamita inflata]